MTMYELLTLLASIVAVVISAVSLVRTRKLAAEQLELARVTAELSRLQIKEISEQDALKTKPQLNVAITKIGNSSNFIISNTGQGSAFDLNMELIDCQDSPLLNDVNEKLPCPEMKPNSRIKLLAAMHLSSPLTYQVKLLWKELSGEQKAETYWVSR